jgi:tRNA/rRNA methyltransferase
MENIIEVSNNIKNFGVILFEPQYPENIGAAARACKNMGIAKLISVRPLNPDKERMLKMATHESAELIESMPVFDSIEEATKDFNYIVGTTARTGRQRWPYYTPREIATSLVSISQNNTIGILFGSERTGLTNHELRLCQDIIHIPTAEFTSINLAQSVMIVCYEILLANSRIEYPCPRLATTIEKEGMFEHIEELLIKIDFILPENPERWMRSIRQFFGKPDIKAKEIKMIRGFCRQLLWAMEGKQDEKPTFEDK